MHRVHENRLSRDCQVEGIIVPFTPDPCAVRLGRARPYYSVPRLCVFRKKHNAKFWRRGGRWWS